MRIKGFQHRFTTNTIEGILKVNSKSGDRLITKLQGMLKVMDNRLTATRCSHTKLDGLKDGLGNLLDHKLTTIGSDSIEYFTNGNGSDRGTSILINTNEDRRQ